MGIHAHTPLLIADTKIAPAAVAAGAIIGLNVDSAFCFLLVRDCQRTSQRINCELFEDCYYWAAAQGGRGVAVKECFCGRHFA